MLPLYQFFANSGSVSSSTFAPLSTSTIKPHPKDIEETATAKTHVLFQKSTAVNQKTITTVESDNEIDNEQILTSASNSFADQYSKPALDEKVVRINVNSIDKNENLRRSRRQQRRRRLHLQRRQKKMKLSRGRKNHQETKYSHRIVFQSQFVPQTDLQSRQKELSQNNHIASPNELQPNRKAVSNLQQFGQQNDLHSKLSAQEFEIQRLNLNLKQQQQINQQQQQALFSTQQQQALLSNQQRLNAKETPFLPIINPVQQPIVQQVPNREAELFKQKTPSVSLLPSLSFDPILEAGKLPTNAQILPSKDPVYLEATFQSPGGFFQPPQNQNNNRFFRSNLESTFTNNNYFRPQEQNLNLNNLLLNSGAFQGRTEDFNIVSKVLSLNHLGGRLKRHKVPHY
nr:unnamed protein product [Callosobruchus analis]